MTFFTQDYVAMEEVECDGQVRIKSSWGGGKKGKEKVIFCSGLPLTCWGSLEKLPILLHEIEESSS